MNDTSLTKLSGTCSLLSAASILTAAGVGIASGGGGPAPMDFGDPALLTRLHAGGAGVMLPEVLALVGPTLALGAGLGWWPIIRSQRGNAALGLLLWYLGMIFVIWQDGMELVLVRDLPGRYFAAPSDQQSAILALGAMLGGAVELFTFLGDLVSFFGLLLVALALLQKGWRWLGGAGALSSISILIGLAIPALAPLRLIGFILFMLWMIGMGLAMLRWRPEVGAPSV